MDGNELCPAAGAAQEAVSGAARNRTYAGARRGGPKSFVTLTGDREFESCSLQRRVTCEPEPPLVLLGAGGPRTQFRYPASKPWESGQMESMTTLCTDR